jgi:4-amino-4-deoxy-L-arabinose transferase-like glycosyltransferase
VHVSGVPLVVGLLLVALVARVGVVLATPDFEPINDAAKYVEHAESIAAGDGYPPSSIVPGDQPTAYTPPGWPYLLGGVFALAGDDVKAARVAQAALVGVAGVALAGLVAFQLWGSVAALLTLGLAAVYPPLVVSASGLLSEPLFVVLELASVAAALALRRSGRLRWAAAAGALAGLAILSRSNGVVLLLPLALAVWGRPAASREATDKLPRLRALRTPAVLLACAALTVAPWTIRNAVVFDQFIPVTTQTGITLAGTYNETSRTDPRFPGAWRVPNADPALARLIARTGPDGEPALDDALGRAAREYALDRPGYVAGVAWRNSLRVLGLGGSDYNRQATAAELDLGSRWNDLFTYGALPFALLAAAGCATAAALRTPRWVWAVPLLMLATSVLASATQRFRQPADPFLLMLAALGLSAALGLIAARRTTGAAER